MNRGKGQGKNWLGGYTIVETLIFLAVSSAMFVAAVLLVNGQQGKAQFVNAVRDFEAQLRDTANNVATGYYNHPDNVGCENSNGQPQLTADSSDTGNCMFVGTVMKLGGGTGDDASKYFVIPMVGVRQVSNLNPTSIGETNPKPVSNAVVTKELQYGATFNCINADGSTDGCKNNQPSNASVGFFANLEGSNNTSSGSIQTDFVSMDQSKVNQGLPTTLNILTNSTASSIGFNYHSTYTSRVNKKTVICIDSGTTNQRGIFRLTPAGGSLSIISEIQGGKCDATVS